MIQDLTVGHPGQVLRRYSVPMFVGVIFQQMYNIADSVIAGKFAGEAALAAVGASYSITMIFMAVAVGSQIGCSVVISQLFGAKDYGRMKTAVSTTLLTGLVLSAVLAAAGVAGSGWLMRLVNTPSDIFADGQLYLGIYVGGFVFLFLYNVATGIFNSLGDSRTPLYFLIGSSLSNIVLDWAFVALFHWGVAGVAWATFLAQGVACVLSLIVLRRRVAQVECDGHHPLFSLAALGNIARIAVPSILQQSFISIGDMFIQGRVNSYGSSVIAGYSAAIKLNTFTITSFTTLANGVSGFTAQNVGAGKHSRVRQGWGAGIRLALCVAVPFFLIFFFGGRICLELFMNADATQLARDTGMEFLRIVSPFYFVVCFKLISDGVLRGAGCMRLFMSATFTDLALRVILAFLFSGLLNAAVGVWMAWPVGWCISTAMSLFFYLRGHWMPDWGKDTPQEEAEELTEEVCAVEEG